MRPPPSTVTSTLALNTYAECGVHDKLIRCEDACFRTRVSELSTCASSTVAQLHLRTGQYCISSLACTLMGAPAESFTVMGSEPELRRCVLILAVSPAATKPNSSGSKQLTTASMVR